MTEMRAGAMGQYGHNNQPSHHLLYLFAQLGDAHTTQRYVREVMRRAYGTDFYAGDEDNGEMGAWFVLSALGLYVTTPSTKEYVLGSPIFPKVRIFRGGKKESKEVGGKDGKYMRYDVVRGLQERYYQPFRRISLNLKSKPAEIDR